MNENKSCKKFIDQRPAFCNWYKTPRGQTLLNMEAKFLSRFLRISYNQQVLQIGYLGWEDQFLDQDLFSNIVVYDRKPGCQKNIAMVIGNLDEIPICNESIDIVIMPHTLEFVHDQHQVLREVDRVLKPEGQLLLLGFNPLSIYGLLHFLPGQRKKIPWCGHFLRRSRIIDWLHLLKFETETSVEFYSKLTTIQPTMLKKKYFSIFSLAYAVKAIKRRYTLIPLKPLWAAVTKQRFSGSRVIETSSSIHSDE